MNNNTIHDLAIAYAQAKLIQSQKEHPEQNGYDEELRSFVKSYNYALQQIPIEYEGFCKEIGDGDFPFS